MGSIKNETFDVEFILRTQKLIQEYRGTYNITLLLNCLLGLIILPTEFYSRKSRTFFTKQLTDYKEIEELIKIISFNPTKRDKKGKGFKPDEKTLNILIKKIRNGIAHQQIECVDKKGKWVSVTIRDFNKFNNNNLELELTWTIKQLKEFSIFISGKYIDEINNINR